MKIWGQNSRHDDGSVGERRVGEGMRRREQDKWREGGKRRKGQGGTERGKRRKDREKLRQRQTPRHHLSLWGGGVEGPKESQMITGWLLALIARTISTNSELAP